MLSLCCLRWTQTKMWVWRRNLYVCWSVQHFFFWVRMTNYTKEHTKKSSNRTIAAQQCCLRELNVCNCFHNRRVTLASIHNRAREWGKKTVKRNNCSKFRRCFDRYVLMMGRDFSSLGHWSIDFCCLLRSQLPANWLGPVQKKKPLRLVAILFIRRLFFHSSSFFGSTNSTHVIALHQIVVFNWIELQDERWFRGRTVFSFQNPISSFVAILCPCLHCAKYIVATPSWHDVCVRVLVINVTLVAITQQQ